MAEALLYQTSDIKFADRAIEALHHAGVPCYRLGQGLPANPLIFSRDFSLGISIYIRHEEDYARANAVIIKLGAVVEPNIALPSWVQWILYAVLVAIACVTVFTLVIRWK